MASTSTLSRDDQTQATQDLIRERAEALFGHYGFSKTSVSDIAKASEMSAGNVYRFYRNKQAIGVAVVEHFFARQLGDMHHAQIAASLTGEERLRGAISAGVRALVKMMDENPRIFEMAEFLYQDDIGKTLLESHRNRLRIVLTDLITQGARDGAFRQTDAGKSAWEILLATTAFWMPQALMAWHDRAQILGDLDRVLDLLMPALRQPDGAA